MTQSNCNTHGNTHCNTCCNTHCNTCCNTHCNCIYLWRDSKICVQGDQDSQFALSCRSFFAKEPQFTRPLCGKWPVKIRHPMGLRHPVIWRQCLCDMTHSCVYWHVICFFIVLSFTWYMLICNMSNLCVRHDSFIRAAWRIYMCDTTHFYVCHDVCICATWLIHMCIDV